MVDTRELTRCGAVLRRGLGVLALLGLFAMHGLTTHGAAHAGHSGEPIPVVGAAGPDHSPHRMGTGTTADSAPAPAVQDDPGSDVDLIGVAGMCLAVLLVGSVGAVLRRRGVAALRGIDVVVRGGGWPARSRRDRDPPCLVALSIQRC